MRPAISVLIAASFVVSGCRENASDLAGRPNDGALPNPPEVDRLLARAAACGGYEVQGPHADPKTVSIRFRTPGPTDDDLAALRPLLLKSTIPVGLDLTSWPAVTDTGLSQLEAIPTIHRLDLAGNKITDEGLKHLSSLKNLRELSLSNDAVTNAGLAPLGKLTSLRHLTVTSKRITDAGYAHLSGLTNLESIRVGTYGRELGDEPLGHMTGMTKLTEVSVGRDNLTDAGMAHLGKLTGLKKLRIDGQKITAAGVAPLAGLKNLQELTVLSGPGFHGDALAALAGLTELRSLELIYTPSIDKVGARHIGKLVGLKSLRFGNARDDGALEGIASLAGLEYLGLYYTFVGDGSMKQIASLTGLQRLSITHSRVTDAGFAHLAKLPKLRSLSAGDNAITDAGLSHLAGIVTLEELHLTDCKLTGSGLRHLTGLAKLKELTVTGNPLTDEHLMVLGDLKGLKELFLTGTKVSDEAALVLKKARPNLRIRDAGGIDVSLEPRVRTRRAMEDLTQVEPAFRLTAEEFFKEYFADENVARKKYQGQVVELTGVVGTCTQNSGGEAYLAFRVGKNDLGVTCATVDEEPWGKVLPEQKIRIKGRWPKDLNRPVFDAAMILDAGEYAGIRLTAEALAKEYAADPGETVKKYDKKTIVLTGEAISKDYNSAGAASIELKSGNKVKVECRFTSFDKQTAKSLKVGRTVTLVGEFTLNSDSGKEVGIYFCLPLTK